MKTRPVSLLLILLVVPGLFAEETAPLTNVDIVRMTSSGVPEKEIIRSIREASSTAFDLDAEMVVELVRAGVSQAVIEVMIEVQPATMPVQNEPEPEEMVMLEVSFPGRDPENPAKNTASLPGSAEDPDQVSILLYVACLSPTHVPDLWQTKTPLGRRFPRHHLIGMIDENTTESGKKNVTIHLVLPESTLMDVPVGKHMLQVGLAGKVDDEGWFPLVSDDRGLDARSGEPALLEIKVSTRGLKWLGRKSVTSSLHALKILTLLPALDVPDP